MDNFLKSLLELSKNETKNNYIYSNQYSTRAQGIAGELGILFKGTSDRYYEQFILTWYCTDSCVGLYAHYFNDEFLAISYQSGRKQRQSYYWASDEIRQKFEKFLAYDESLNNPEISALRHRKLQLERELSYVNAQIEGEEYYGFPTIDTVDWIKLVKSIINMIDNSYRKFGIENWQRVEELVKQSCV